MNEKDEDTRTAMDALDDGLSDDAAEGSMPLGFEQEQREVSRLRKIKHYAIVYVVVGLGGFILAPVALMLRTGRWTFRTLFCYHNGHEFGEW
jgi:hypothetical protein